MFRIYSAILGDCEEELPEKSVGPMTVLSQLTVGGLLANSWPSDGQQFFSRFLLYTTSKMHDTLTRIPFSS